MLALIEMSFVVSNFNSVSRDGCRHLFIVYLAEHDVTSVVSTDTKSSYIYVHTLTGPGRHFCW